MYNEQLLIGHSTLFGEIIILKVCPLAIVVDEAGVINGRKKVNYENCSCRG